LECDGVVILLLSPEDQKLRLYALDLPENPSDIEESRELPVASEAAGAARRFEQARL
jgi:hypothetical protein